MCPELQARILTVAKILNKIEAKASPIEKQGHDEPEVDALLNKIDFLMADLHRYIEAVKTIKQDQKYKEAAQTADKAVKSLRLMLDYMSKSHNLLVQKSQ